MEKMVENLYSEDILARFLSVFHLDETVIKLGDFENYVFEVRRDDQPKILRVTHSSHRNKQNIEAELDWIQYLYQNGVNCPEVYQSLNQSYIETIKVKDGSYFYGCLFSKVEGAAVKTHSVEYNKKLFYAWGKEIGKMHSVTKNYHPNERLLARPSWAEEELLDAKSYFPSDHKIIDITNDLIKDLEALPKTKDNYGLIHSDVHSGNFFYDGEEIYVFDFDDCSYHWFASDIAIPVYYSIFFGLQSVSAEEKTEFTNHFLQSFIEGYKSINPLPDNWEEQLPLFLRLRDITLYSVLHKKIAPEDRDDELNNLIKVIYQRIIRGEAIVQL